MSRKDSLPALERRVRRIAVRHGLDMMKAHKPDAKVLQHGGYMLRDAVSYKIVFGDRAYPYSADLDEVEAYLLALSPSPEDG